MDEILLLHADFDRGRREVDLAAEALAEGRRRADRQVTALLEGDWSGPAGAAFGEAWRDWVRGATDVAEGLHAAGRLLAVAQRDLVEQDDDSQARLDAVSARILERLG
jgi:uncharacterized protein YukE